MSFLGRAAAQKPKITMSNVKHWLEWCKARNLCTLEPWKRVRWSQATIPVERFRHLVESSPWPMEAVLRSTTECNSILGRCF